MRYVVSRHIATAVRWPQRGIMPHKRTSVARVTWPILEPVGVVRAVSFDHARTKARAAYPAVEPELLRVTSE